MYRDILFAACSVLLLSCAGKDKGRLHGDGDRLKLEYAENMEIIDFGEYTQVNLADPWNAGKTLHTYILVPQGRELPGRLPEGTIVRTPLRRCVVGTSVHCALADMLGRRQSIAGVCDLRYINLPWVKALHEKGGIADCGSGMSPNIEKIMETGPDAIFLSPFQNSGGYGRVSELGIPVIEVADYMETSALGRAEWIKFYGLLFGAAGAADSIFSAVESNYRLLARQAKGAAPGRRILMDKQTGSVWYVPGGRSTVGRVLADANARYPWSSDGHSGSLSLPFETVLEKSGDADVWMIKYNGADYTLATLLSENAGYSQFKAFRDGEVYGCNTAAVTFYEDTPFRPDLLLREFILIAHPGFSETLGEPRYYRKIGN